MPSSTQCPGFRFQIELVTSPAFEPLPPSRQPIFVVQISLNLDSMASDSNNAALTRLGIITQQLCAAATSPAFPQARTAVEFPSAVHDALNLDGLLTKEEQAVKQKVRKFMVSPTPVLLRRTHFQSCKCSYCTA